MKINEVKTKLNYSDILEEYVYLVARYGMSYRDVDYWITDNIQVVRICKPIVIINEYDNLLIFVNDMYHNYKEKLKTFNCINYKNLTCIKYKYNDNSNTYFVK